MSDGPLSSETSSVTTPWGGATEFRCSVRASEGDGAWLGLSGELDLATAPHLAQSLDDALASSRLVVVDLRELRFMDSAGLKVILAAEHRARQTGRRLTLVRGPGQIDRLLRVTGASEHLEITDLSLTQAAADGLDENSPAAS